MENKGIPATVAHVLPHLNPDEQQEMFERTIVATGSRQAAEERFESCVRCIEAQATAKTFVSKPPPGIALQSANIGPYKLFYHRADPEPLRAWSFYFGLADQGPESIIEDWRQEGISVSIEINPEMWEKTLFLLVIANDRVRISYRDAAQEEKIEEFVFPDVPVKRLFPTHRL